MNEIRDGAETISAENAVSEGEAVAIAVDNIGDAPKTPESDSEISDALPDGDGENETQSQGDTYVDYAAIVESDVAALRAEFPELAGITNVTELNNPMRYAALRDLGLTPSEAYLATAVRAARDTRAHLRSAHGRSAAPSESTMTHRELAMARDLFPGKNDQELHSLYKRVRN